MFWGKRISNSKTEEHDSQNGVLELSQICLIEGSRAVVKASTDQGGSTYVVAVLGSGTHERLNLPLQLSFEDSSVKFSVEGKGKVVVSLIGTLTPLEDDLAHILNEFEDDDDDDLLLDDDDDDVKMGQHPQIEDVTSEVEEDSSEDAPAPPPPAKELKKVAPAVVQPVKVVVPKDVWTPNGEGVKYQVVEIGNGKMATTRSKVKVQYEGVLAKNGKKFDSGVLQFTVGAGEMIRGFDVGVRGMLLNEKRKIHIPHKLGYGSKKVGSIPPFSDLIFSVKLLSC